VNPSLIARRTKKTNWSPCPKGGHCPTTTLCKSAAGACLSPSCKAI
jgi:hypothetical protein